MIFEFLRTFLRIPVMLVNEVCEIVLIISDSTKHEFSTAILTDLLKF